MGNVLQQNNQKVSNIEINVQQPRRRHMSCYQACQEIYQYTKFQIGRLYPFSHIDDQKPYAIPMEANIYAPAQSLVDRVQQIILIESQFLQKPLYKKKSSRIQSEQMNKNYIKPHDNVNQQQSKQNTQISAIKKHSSRQQQFCEYDEKYWKKQTPNVVIQGHWKQHLPHDLCRVYFPKGQIFVGYFDSGRPILDDCILIFQNGSYYHGSLVNFKFQGKKGKYVSQDDKIIYEGQWKNDVPCGKGKQIIQTQKQIIQYQGTFNRFGQKQGQDCSYVVKNKYKQSEKFYEYKGGFKNNQFYGQSVLKTNNGQNILKGNFSKLGGQKKGQNQNQKIQVKSLQTNQFIFEGQLQRSFLEGNGKVTVKNNKGFSPQMAQKIDNQSSATTIYTGEIKNGKLYGKGSIIKNNSQNVQNSETFQNVYWFDGIKLKHMKNFIDQDQLRFIIKKIEQQFQKVDKYSQLTKNLTQYFNTHSYHAGNEVRHHGVSLSSKSIPQKKQHRQRFLFEMISQQKVKTIIMGSNQSSSKPGNSPLRTQNRKQLIIELDKGKQLYMSSYKIHLQENGGNSSKLIV